MSFSQYLLDAHEQYRLQVRLRNGWIIRWRWWYLTVLAAVAIATSYTSTRIAMEYRDFIAGLFVTGLLLNAVLWAVVRFGSHKTWMYHLTATVQIILDTALAAAVVYFQGGIDSRATVLFAVPILAAGVLFKPAFAYLAAMISALFYSGALALYVQIEKPGYALDEITLPAAFYTSVFLLLAIIVSGYTARNNAKEREDSYAELLSLLRHQLHHPTGVIAAIVEMLEHSEGFTKLSQKDKAYIRQLKHENHRIHSMISNVLQVADVQRAVESTKGKWGDVDLMALVSNCATNIAVSYKRIDDLALEIPNEHVIVHGQEEKLQLAFENIIDNAFKFSNGGHKVVINLLAKKVPTIEIDIIDHGEGISAKDQRKLFRAFTNIDEASKDGQEAIKSYSMGLGLYISKIIIEQHGGKLALQSKPGEGTKVIVQLKRDMWRYLYGQK